MPDKATQAPHRAGKKSQSPPKYTYRDISLHYLYYLWGVGGRGMPDFGLNLKPVITGGFKKTAMQSSTTQTIIFHAYTPQRQSSLRFFYL